MRMYQEMKNRQKKGTHHTYFNKYKTKTTIYLCSKFIHFGHQPFIFSLQSFIGKLQLLQGATTIVTSTVTAHWAADINYLTVN